MRSTITAAVAVATVLMLSACSAPADPAEPSGTDPSADASTYGGFAIDPPADDEVVLTIEAGSSLDFTYAELQRLATVEVDILEPFVEEQQSFTGVLLSDLLGLADVPLDGRIETVALNDYRYSDSVTQWVDNEAVLAVFRDGELIPMDQGGPIRIIFAESSPAFELLDAWNWSLRSIEVVE